MVKGAKYLLRNTTKARVKIGVVGSRAQLAYKDLTKAAAAGENTKIQRGIRQLASGSRTDGAALKNGMIGMLDRIGGSTEQYNRIMAMDENVLASMYDSNDMTFEVFFNYEGIQKTPSGVYMVSDEKRKDIDWFIEQYDKIEMTAVMQTYGNDVI